jgi:TolB-like protein
MGFFDELKRRNVFRVGAAYVVLGWVVVQVTETISPAFNLPDWTLAFVIWVGVIGLPFVLFFSWAFEITPDGVKKESEVDRTGSIADVTGKKLDVALVALLVLAIALFTWDSFFNATDKPANGDNAALEAGEANAGAQAPGSIAVLPLHNMSAIPDNEYFVGGIHEEILTNLSRVENLRVVSRTTALRYIGSDLSMNDIGRELAVRYIVEGSVRRIKDHVRITVQLIDAATDAHLWARNYDRQLVDVFATQSEVAREIARSIQLEILPDTVGSLDNMPTHSVKAYDLYVKANSIDRSNPSTESSYRQQRELLDAAVAEDPDFVEAWGRLNFVLDEIARTIVQLDWFGDSEAERDAVFAETREAAQRALDRAVALDPDNVETLLALATDFVAEQEDGHYRLDRKKYIDRALEVDPENAFSWYTLGWWYHIAGRDEEAREPFLKALELDPLHAHIVGGALIYFRNVGDQDMTTLLSERLIQIAPELGDEEGLTKVTSYSRLNGIIWQLVQSADAAKLDSYVQAFAEEQEDFVGNAGLDEHLWWYEASLFQLRNDLDRLVDLTVGPLSDDPAHNEVMHFMHASSVVLSAQRIVGETTRAEDTARRILAAADSLETDLHAFPPILEAHAILGDDDKLREALQPVLDNLADSAAAQNPWTYVSIAHLDPGRAVDLLLAQKTKHPDWLGPSVIALNHVTARHLLIHPDMQAFYVKQGKWIPYLSKRVPEYGQYAQ